MLGEKKLDMPKTHEDCYKIYEMFRMRYSIIFPEGRHIFYNARRLVTLNNEVFEKLNDINKKSIEDIRKAAISNNEFLDNGFRYDPEYHSTQQRLKHEYEVFMKNRKETITLKDTKPVIIGTIPIENKKKGGN